MAQNNFETSLAALEKIVRDLEVGDLQLEESLTLFEIGVRLARECQERLDQAERRVEILLRDSDGNPRVEALDEKTLVATETEPKVKRRIVFESDDENEKNESVF